MALSAFQYLETRSTLTPGSAARSDSRWWARRIPRCKLLFDGNFTEVVTNQLLASTGTWRGIPGQESGWPSNLQVEFEDQAGKTRVVVREGPHPEGTAEMGRQAWEMMLDKIDSLFNR